jgi:hypothetical protein
MIVKLRVGGITHDVVLPDEESAKNFSSPFNYLVKHRTMAETYLNIIYEMSRDLPQGQDVTDLMGGIGLFAKVLWPLLRPKSWTLVEIDPQCEYYIQEPRATFKLASAYDNPTLSPIVYIDQATGTLRTIADNMDGRKGMYDAIKLQRPDHVIITDFGYYWIHLPNHAPWYIEHFGEKPDKRRYHLYWDEWFQKNLQYKIHEFRTGAGSQYFHMVPI